MARKDEVHTVHKAGGSGWVNKVGGQTKSEHRKQSNAIHTGKNLAKDLETEHVIHGRDGKIREKNSYGNDPYPPKG